MNGGEFAGAGFILFCCDFKHGVIIFKKNFVGKFDKILGLVYVLNMANSVTRKIVYAAVFAAIYVVLDYFSIQVLPSLRITISMLAVALAGSLLGWQYGGMVGLVGDVLMFFLKNSAFGPYMPQLTISAILVGVIFGLVVYRRKNLLARVIVAQILVTLFINIVWNTWTLSLYYTGSFWYFLTTRVWTELGTMVVLIILEYLLLLVFRRIIHE